MHRIASAHCYMLEYDLKGYKLSYGIVNAVRNVVLKLVDTDGVAGWGEADPMQPFTEESAEDVFAVLKTELLPRLLSQTSVDPIVVNELLDKAQADHLIAKGAISMALLDIQGKRQGVPVAHLLGDTINKSLPVLWPLSDQTVEDDILHIDEKTQEGYQSFMLKMGRRTEHGSASISRQATRVKALSDRYGDNLKIIADANTGWTVKETQHFLNEIESKHLVFLEQPINKRNMVGMAAIALQSHTPISADESFTGAARS